MAALLIALSIMSIAMTVAMPVWRQTVQREKEEELVFRGQQYARAVGLFERKYANAPPPSLDVLVQEKFLRKKFKDPITNADFVPIAAGTQNAAVVNQGQGAAGTPTAAGALADRIEATRQAVGGRGQTGGVNGGIVGVTSASRARSLRIYNGGTHYNEWRFVYAPPAATPGAATGAGGATGGGNQRGGGPGAGGAGGVGGGIGRGGAGQGRGPGGQGRGPQGPDGQGPGQGGRGPGGANPGGGQGGSPQPFALPPVGGRGR